MCSELVKLEFYYGRPREDLFGLGAEVTLRRTLSSRAFVASKSSKTVPSSALRVS